MNTPIRLGYLASGSGSSVEALATKINSGELEGFTSIVVLCNKPRGSAGIYERGARLGIPVEYAPTTYKMISALQPYDVDLILGLGFIKIVEPALLNLFPNRVLNIHPTLLPDHGGKGMYGLATHMSVLESADTETGPTVHLMNERFDEGCILRQNRIEVPNHIVGQPTEENAKILQQLVLQEEYVIMPQVLADIRDGSIKIGL
jgi:phosphoribosylglycinamide formyltransferase-1